MKDFSLAELAAKISGRVIGSGAARARGVAVSTAAIAPGSIFVAVRGVKADGHSFVAEALRRGAAAAVVHDGSSLPEGAAGIVVDDTRTALSRLAALFAGDPSREMRVVGVTGTNGKTTINWLTHHALLAAHGGSLRVGTLGIRSEKRGGAALIDLPGDLTTPDAVSIQQALATALKGGIRHAVFEASSHALDQARLADVAFDAAIFTNLTRDHLDYHGDMERYFAAKAKLFGLTAAADKARLAVINLDSDYGARMAAEAKSRGLSVVTFGENTAADLRILSFDQSLQGSRLAFGWQGKKRTLESGFIGIHNASNLAAAFAALAALGEDEGTIVGALENAPQVPGRLEAVPGAPFGIYVDYAHTPDALENVLKALRALVRNNLWVVFGCGGDRDRGKRPIMAKVARELADRVAVTSDNPRTEKPEAIIADILSGGCKAEIVDADRRAAIGKVLASAAPGDAVLIAGKGHEDYQIIGTTKYPFSDVEEARRALAKIAAEENV
jgi:UDP-N-acetylmuramoyl-L-alanyl-D-glutamate--2,6-diaminopimelate ligase